MNFVRSGFRTVRQIPALIFGEIAWRWAFGLTAWLLLIFTVRTIMEGIDVSGTEIALAQGQSPYAIADAAVRVLVQVLPRLGHALLILVPCLAALWIVSATLGRAATLVCLDREPDRSAGFQPAAGSPARAAFSGDGVQVPQASSRRFLSLFGLNVLRAVFTLATFLAFFGTVFLVSAQLTPSTTAEVAPAYVLAWLFLAFLVGCLWGFVNWFLALAPVFIVRDGMGVWKSLSASLGLYRDSPRDYMSIATWFGFFRGGALLIAVVAGIIAVAASPRAGLIASAVIALVYFAIADWLYIVRLTAYVHLAESAAVQGIATAAAPSPEPGITRPPETETETESHSELS